MFVEYVLKVFFNHRSGSLSLTKHTLIALAIHSLLYSARIWLRFSAAELLASCFSLLEFLGPTMSD